MLTNAVSRGWGSRTLVTDLPALLSRVDFCWDDGTLIFRCWELNFVWKFVSLGSGSFSGWNQIHNCEIYFTVFNCCRSIWSSSQMSSFYCNTYTLLTTPPFRSKHSSWLLWYHIVFIFLLLSVHYSFSTWLQSFPRIDPGPLSFSHSIDTLSQVILSIFINLKISIILYTPLLFSWPADL